MKTTHLLLAALLLLPYLARAQSQVPGLISYQGIVTDTGGNLVGNAAPVNREVFFRIWDSSTASDVGNLVYSERQVVTISKGEFSVLIGQGAVVTGTPLGYSETGKGPPTVTVATAFAGSGRYLGVTVDDGTAAADVEITPRQQMVSTAFTLRAKEAETVVGGSIGTASLADTSVTLAKMASGSVSSTAIVDGSIASADLAAGSVTKAKLGSDVGFWDIAAGNVYRSTGNVGIGMSTAPAGKLHVIGSTDTIITQASAANGSAGVRFNDFSGTERGYIGNAGAASAIHTGTFAGDFAVKATTGHLMLAAPTGSVLINPGSTGKVGIGTTTNNMSGSRMLTVGTVQGMCIGDELTAGNTSLIMSLSAASGGYANIQAIKNQGSSFGDIVLNNAGGNVGISTTVPAHKLDVVAATWPQLRLGIEPAAFAKRMLKIGYNNEFGTDGGGAIMAEEQSNFYRDLYVSPYATAPNQGYVAIGQTTTPSHMLTVAGVCRSTQASFATSSDARVKEHITLLSGSLERLMKLKPVNFDYIKAFQKGRGGLDQTQTGFIAQEVQEVFPDMVTQAVEKVGEQEIKDFRVLNTSSLTPHLVSATQELARKVEALEKANAEKDTALAAMTQRLAALEARDKARDAKLAAIEAMLSGDKPAALPVSLKKSMGGAE